MKKLSLLLLTLTLCFFSACHNSIWDAIDGLDIRVTKLEELCKEMNTNITSLQTIVSVLQSNDYITGIVEIKKNGEVIGHTITFGKHDPITIYHGQDGKDGQNGADGKDGQDGVTPIIGIAQDTDGVYYWTLNGEWLLDDNGNKLPVSGTNGKDGQDGSNGQDGTDGKDGQDGTDGKDGQDGVDGKDGVTPQLKIEEGYWYISYDNGATWTQLGKATGEDGKDGQDGSNGTDGKDGKDGQDGDSMFQSVTQDENYVYFTLADGTVIKIAKGTSTEEEQPNSEFMFIVTYDANGGEGIMQPDTFYYGVLKALSNNAYTKSSYEFVNWNTKVDGSGISYEEGQNLMISKNIKLYAQWAIGSSGIENVHEWVDLGLSIKWATCNVGATKPEEYGDYFAWGETQPKSTYDWSTYKWYNGSNYTLTKYCTNSSYGTVDNKTTLELSDDAARANWGGSWRMPTKAERDELRESCTWTWTTQNGVKGYKVTSKKSGYTNKSIFLPSAGYRDGSSLSNAVSNGYYWLSSLDTDYPNSAGGLLFGSGLVALYYTSRYTGRSVRPVCQ